MKPFQIVVTAETHVGEPKLEDIEVTVDSRYQHDIQMGNRGHYSTLLMRRFKPKNGVGLDALERLELLFGKGEEVTDVQEDIEDLMTASFQYGIIFARKHPEFAERLCRVNAADMDYDDMIARADNAPARVAQAQASLDEARDEDISRV